MNAFADPVHDKGPMMRDWMVGTRDDIVFFSNTRGVFVRYSNNDPNWEILV